MSNINKNLKPDWHSQPKNESQMKMETETFACMYAVRVVAGNSWLTLEPKSLPSSEKVQKGHWSTSELSSVNGLLIKS